MMQPLRRWRLGIMLALMCLTLSFSSCLPQSSNVLPGLDTSNCDPKVRADCWSVSEEYVKQRMLLGEQVVRLKDALKICREKP